MLLRVPDYYEQFECLASHCKDSCCIGWEIDIDKETYEYYKSVDGEFGKRLRSKIMNEEEPSFILQKGGRCPFLNKENLCDICLNLGESALCEICTEYPRFTLTYDHVCEKCLGLSCEEAGRLIFLDDKKTTIKEIKMPESFDAGVNTSVNDEQEEQTENVIYYEKARDMAITILQSREKKIEHRISLFLQFCKETQEILNRGVEQEIIDLIHNYEDILMDKQPSIKIEPAKEETIRSYYEERMDLFDGMEILDEEWRDFYKRIRSYFECNDYNESIRMFMEAYDRKEYEYEHLMVYFTFRYFMKSVFDSNVLAKAKFAVASFLMIRDMDAVRYFENDEKFEVSDRIDVARIYSKEVEHSEDNLEYLAECFLFEDIFQTEAMLEQVIR